MNIEMVRLYDIYAPLLNERQREILSLYYNEDESLAEISENVGITRQGVRDCIVKSEALLCEFEAALKLREKALKFDSMIDALKAEAKANGADEALLNKISALKDL